MDRDILSDKKMRQRTVPGHGQWNTGTESITFAIILYILVLETLLSGCRDGESAQVANAMVKTKM